jgi:nucleotide-binding universal stress UspA family protein
MGRIEGEAGRMSGLVLGSVSAKLAGTADCAVLTVK